MRAILPLEQRAGCDRDVRRVLRQEVFEDDDELIGAPVGKRREQHGIYDGEQRRRRCDDDGEHHRGECSQAARAAQHTHAVLDVLQHFFEGQPASLVAPRLLRTIDAPELALRGRVRGGRIETAALEVARQFVDVKSQLVVQLRVAPSSRRPTAIRRIIHSRMARSYSLVRRIRLMIPEVRTQSSVACFSWRRPVAVSE